MLFVRGSSALIMRLHLGDRKASLDSDCVRCRCSSARHFTVIWHCKEPTRCMSQDRGGACALICSFCLLLALFLSAVIVAPII